VITAQSHINGHGADHVENTASLLLRRVYRRHVFNKSLIRKGLHNPVALLVACFGSHGKVLTECLPNSMSVHHNVVKNTRQAV
jgi:hypothetical protein